MFFNDHELMEHALDARHECNVFLAETTQHS